MAPQLFISTHRSTKNQGCFLSLLGDGPLATFPELATPMAFSESSELGAGREGGEGKGYRPKL